MTSQRGGGGPHLEHRRRGVGVDQQQRRCPLATEQEVQRVVVSHRSQVQQLTSRGLRGSTRVQLHPHLGKEEEKKHFD